MGLQINMNKTQSLCAGEETDLNLQNNEVSKTCESCNFNKEGVDNTFRIIKTRGIIKPVDIME